MKRLLAVTLAVGQFALLLAAVVPSRQRSKELVLKELTAASEASDGEAVLRLTDELKALVPAPRLRRTASSSSVSVLDAAAANASAVGFLSRQESQLKTTHKHDGAAQVQASNAAAIFDDAIFMMTPEAKQDLRTQLQKPEAIEAISWIQTGGFYHCAYEGQNCNCNGDVKYGAPHSQQWSAVTPVTGSVACSAGVFGDPAPGQGKQCVCHRAKFTLTKNENSGSYMQESWIMMLRVLARLKWLPFTGDRRYHGMELWSARHGGHTGGTLERYWIEKYIVEQYKNIPGGNCLEWGLYYTNWLSQCTNKYENKYEAVKYGQKSPSVEGNIVYSSIYDFPTVIGGAGIQFNFICAVELFEHLEKPYEAAADLYNILAPGGVVLFTAPQQAQYHKVPQDFLRYTKEGAKHVMEVAGFCVPPQLMAGSGDFIFDTARNTGMQLQDFTIEELDEGYQRGYDSIADGAITIHAMAFKPPHVYCR